MTKIIQIFPIVSGDEVMQVAVVSLHSAVYCPSNFFIFSAKAFNSMTHIFLHVLYFCPYSCYSNHGIVLIHARLR